MSKKTLRVSCVQVNAGPDVSANIEQCRREIARACRVGADLICLPEVFHYRGPARHYARVAVRRNDDMIRAFRALARKEKIALLLGSVIERSRRPSFFYNTSILISPAGMIAAYYRKVHLFDIRLKGGPSVAESRIFLPGRRSVTAPVFGIRMGLSICYDLRFPEHFRKLALSGARLIFCPANFTDKTGRAHWEVLLRARAIENQVFVVAPAQTGVDPASGILCHGRSLVIDPWGKILAQGDYSRPGVITADLDLSEQVRLRRSFPVLTSCRTV
jgi:predicted amidohydrolase